MGQYHKIVCPTRREFIPTHMLGSGLKAWEQMANHVTPACLVALISAAPGNEPGDVAWDGVTGRWAGEPVALIGDYAEDGDIPGWTFEPESSIYGLCLNHDHEPDPEIEDQTNPYLDIGPQLKPLLEYACGIRLVGTGWVRRIPVTYIGAGCYVLDRSRISAPPAWKDKADEFIRQFYGTPEERNRAPAGRAPGPDLSAEDATIGQPRLIVDLDRREYLDPAKFAEPATTAAMMRGEWRTASALFALITHPERRGGGDLVEHPYVGRWRGHRLVATTNRVPKFPSLDEVRESFTDISAKTYPILANEGEEEFAEVLNELKVPA